MIEIIEKYFPWVDLVFVSEDSGRDLSEVHDYLMGLPVKNPDQISEALARSTGAPSSFWKKLREQLYGDITNE